MNRSPARILLIPGYSVGDSICFGAAVHVLKQCYPDIVLDVLAYRSTTRDIFLHNPDIRKIISSPTDAEIHVMRTQYDLILSFPFIDESYAWIQKLGIKTFFPGVGDQPLAKAVLRLIQKHFPKCKVADIETYRICPQAQHFLEAKQLLLSKGADLSGGEMLIGCHVGCASVAGKSRSWWKRLRRKYSSKVWPAHRYVTLLKKLIQYNPRVRLVLSGTSTERPLIEELFRKYKPYVYDVSGETSISSLAAMMPSFQCFVSADTGPMHLAVAMDIPLIALFSPRTYEMGRPYPSRSYRHVILKPRMQDITVEEVFSALLPLIENAHVKT